jgi:hypothetical protein
MIVLSATRVDGADQFHYTVAPAGRSTLATDDAGAAAALLRQYGVEDAYRLVAHARNWGMVEIVEPPRDGR